MNGASTIELALRLVLSMGMILGILALGMRFLRRRGGEGLRLGGRRGELEVVERRGLTKGASVALVRVGDRTVLVGVTDRSVQLLTPLEDSGATSPAEGADRRDEALAPTVGTVGEATDVTPGARPSPVAALAARSFSPQGSMMGRLRHTAPRGAVRHAGAARWTGSASSTPEVVEASSRMGFVEAMREMTVRRS